MRRLSIGSKWTIPSDIVTRAYGEGRSKIPQVYTLLVEVGRSKGMGYPKVPPEQLYCAIPADATKPRQCAKQFQVLKSADLAPLDVTSYGTRPDREADGHEIGEDDLRLMDRALAENAVIVAETTVLKDKKNDRCVP